MLQGLPPCTPTVTRRDTSPEPPVTPPRSNSTTASTTSILNLSPTTPTATSTSASRNPLSISEPTLRFPRPLGSRHLANWISSSNPDIMRVTTTEDTGLSESTYELISGTDTESQDENYNESMSESVGSLDFHRPDDIHSIADTERTFDDESVADGLEPQAQLAPENEDGERAAEILEQSRMATKTLANNDDAEPESEDDARSRSSLEYTQQSLKTPSIPTPEASKIVDRSTEAVESWLDAAASDDESDPNEDAEVSLKSSIQRWHQYIWGSRAYTWGPLRQTGFDIPPGILILIALLIPAFFSSPPSDPHNPAATSVLTIHPTTTALPTSQASSTSWALSTSTATADLVPLEDIKPDEWLFGGKKPELAVFKQQNDNYLVRIPSDVKRTWVSKKCLMFSATRGVDTVPIDVSSADDGVVIKFPQKETYGTVQVEITALCRPKVHQVFRITFEKSIVGGALERTKNLAQDLTDLVPAAAQEAERCLGEARRSLESASDNMLTVSDSLFKELSTRFHNAHRSLGYIKVNARTRIHETAEKISDKVESITDKVSQQLLTAQDVQDQAQLSLLDAQITARLWWLKVAGYKDEHDRYEDKAKAFMAEKKANAIEASKARHPDANSVKKRRAPLLNTLFRGPRCGTKSGRGKRATQQCNHVA